MNRKAVLAIALAALAVASTGLSAPLTINFCTDTAAGIAECASDHIAEARLTIDEVLNGDTNDYTATLFFRGAAAMAPAVIDQVQFTIDGAGEDDYEALPAITSAPGGTAGDPNGDWVAHFGGVPNCGGPGNHNSVCGVGAQGLLGNGGTLTWVFTFDLDDAFGKLSETHFVNMRASFERGQFSPSGGNLTGGSGGSSNLPEPVAVSLLGLAALGLARRLRSRA